MRSKKFIVAAVGALSLTGGISGLAFAGNGGPGGSGGINLNIGVPIAGDGSNGGSITNNPANTANAGCQATTIDNQGACSNSTSARTSGFNS